MLLTATPASAQECPNAEFRHGPSATLPECRAYEMVSLADKGDGEVGTVLGFAPRWGLTSESGTKFIYPASMPFEDPAGFTVADYYYAERGEDGWISKSISPPAAPFDQFVGPYTPVRISRDFTHAIQFTNMDPTTDADLPEDSALFLFDIGTGTYELFATQENDPTLGMAARPVVGADDFRPLYFEDTEQLTPDAPAAGTKVYRYMDGEVTLASRLPDGTPTTGVIFRLNNQEGLNRISRDGSVLYFDAPTGGAALYRRDDDGVTQIAGAATLLTVSADGSRAFFTTSQSLVDEDDDEGQPDIYMYDHSEPEGSRLTVITVDNEPGDGAYTNSDGLVGASADGHTIYFVAAGQLVSGEPQAPQRKLYLWSDEQVDGGIIEYLGGLRDVDSDAWKNSPTAFDARPGQVAPNGRYVALVTATALTADENGGLPQVYVYDSQLDTWSCASCRKGGSATAAAAFRMPISFIRLNWRPPRNVSTSGHVFFETEEALVPHDTNGKTDVYVWRGGEVHLLSSGRDNFASHFADASVDGTQVFFATRSQLAAADTDNRVDIYNASVEGGLPSPPIPPAECSGDECQGPQPQTPPDLVPGSGSYTGPGKVSQGASAICVGEERALNRAKNRLRSSKQRLKDAKRKSATARRRVRKRVKSKQRQVKKARTSLRRCRKAQR